MMKERVGKKAIILWVETGRGRYKSVYGNINEGGCENQRLVNSVCIMYMEIERLIKKHRKTGRRLLMGRT